MPEAGRAAPNAPSRPISVPQAALFLCPHAALSLFSDVFLTAWRRLRPADRGHVQQHMTRALASSVDRAASLCTREALRTLLRGLAQWDAACGASRAPEGAPWAWDAAVVQAVAVGFGAWDPALQLMESRLQSAAHGQWDERYAGRRRGGASSSWGGGGGRGSIRMAVHRRRRRGAPPPPQTKVTVVGNKGNLQSGKSGRAILGTQNFASQPPPSPPLPPTNGSLGGGGLRGASAVLPTPNPRPRLRDGRGVDVAGSRFDGAEGAGKCCPLTVRLTSFLSPDVRVPRIFRAA